MFSELLTSIRLTVATMLLLCVGYTAALLGGARLLAPEGRLGDLAVVDGAVVGSWRVAQEFKRPEYVSARPSAVGYAANATGGSNLSPANPAIAERAAEILGRLGSTADNPAPADLVTASGSGIDPHVTLAGALHQAPRIALARGAAVANIEGLIRRSSEDLPGPGSLVNVLKVNILLDREAPTGERRANP